MIHYANLNGNSAVVSYEMDDTSIVVEFDNGYIYLYTYISTGSANIEEMKSLAIAGRGLCSFIGKVVKKNFAKRLR
jgi:hypothetical protein